MNLSKPPSETANSRTAIDTLAWLIEEDWTATPSGNGRSIADILEHVSWSKWMYEDYAFGSASLRGVTSRLLSRLEAHARVRTMSYLPG